MFSIFEQLLIEIEWDNPIGLGKSMHAARESGYATVGISFLWNRV
ncbi:MAG: hypothetical protein AB7S65_06520 [Sulfuricurvum sp.]